MTVGDEPLFTSIQTTWNLLETSAGPALAEAAAAGADVIVKEAVANGRLAQPWASRVLSGAVRPAQVASNAAAAALALPDDVVADLGTLAEHPGAYWATRSRRAWR